MGISAQTSAVLLLTLRLEMSEARMSKPLTSTEWARLAQWLHSHDMSPASLFEGNVQRILSGFEDRTISTDRIVSLLDRGIALGFALEKWQRAGIWVLTRCDDAYPKRLKQRLKWKSPACLFGVGNQKILESPGIAVVGSRNAPRDACKFSTDLGRCVSTQGYNLVSGGARGIDTASMTGATRE